MTRLHVPGYRMGMAQRPRICSRVVILVAVAATLLATWLPPARACACVPATAAAVQGGPGAVAAPAGSCLCCRHRPADEADFRSCCRAHDTAEPGANGSCGCNTSARPDNPEPAVPPRPSDTDEGGSPTAADAAPAYGLLRPPPDGRAAEVVLRRHGLPPIDLVISLSRLTC